MARLKASGKGLYTFLATVEKVGILFVICTLKYMILAH